MFYKTKEIFIHHHYLQYSIIIYLFIISSFIPFKNGFIPDIYILLVYTIYILIYYIYSNNSIIKLKNLNKIMLY